jgi:hypothetical protein
LELFIAGIVRGRFVAKKQADIKKNPGGDGQISTRKGDEMVLMKKARRNLKAPWQV